MPAKQQLNEYCLQQVEERISRMQEEINQIQAAANSETKSSAGDKYETQRAMAQLEVQRNSQQLAEAEKQRNTLLALAQVRSDTVLPGSLVTTSQGIFYIAISLGKVELNQQPYYVISAESPVGKLLLGNRVGDSIIFNSKKFDILSVE